MVALALAVLVLLGAVTGPRASAASGNPLSSRPFYVDPDTWARWAAGGGGSVKEATVIARIAQTRWITSRGGPYQVRADVDRYVSAATRSGRLPLLTLYAIPHRDCGGYSAGGVVDSGTYGRWIASVIQGIAGRQVAVVLEPDALSSLNCLPSSARIARYAMLENAVRQLTAAPSTAVYIDVGHSRWLAPSEAARRLTVVGVGRARGFSLNVSNFLSTAEEVRYGEEVARLLGGSHYVIDTSRNGQGPAPDASLNWCNPSGRALGIQPTTATRGEHADAYLWIKHPGESDGDCGRGEPTSGTWFDSYAVGLVQRTASS